MPVFEAVCYNCGTVLGRASSKVPVKDYPRWLRETRERCGGCSKCGRSSSDPRFVVRGRVVAGE